MMFKGVAKGFTLVELILYIAASVVMLVGLTTTYSVVTLSRLKTEVVAEVEQQGAFVMQRISSQVMNAEGINSPIPGIPLTSLSLNVFDPGADPTTIALYPGGVMQLRRGTADLVPLTNNKVVVSNVAFYNLSRSGTPGTVRATFKLSYAGGGRKELTYERTFYVSANLRLGY